MKTLSARVARFLGFLLALSVFLVLLVQPLPVLLGCFSGQWRVDGSTSASAAIAVLLMLFVAWAEKDGLGRGARVIVR